MDPRRCTDCEFMAVARGEVACNAGFVCKRDLVDAKKEIESLRYGRSMLRFLPAYGEIKTCLERVIYYFEDKVAEQQPGGMEYAIEEGKKALDALAKTIAAGRGEGKGNG